MWKEMIAYSADNYYLDFVVESEQALSRYAAARGQSDEASSNTREQSRLALEALMVKAAWKTSENSYLNIEHEFFAEGELSSERLSGFQRELLKQASKEQMLTSFWGTTGTMTGITRRSMEAEGQSYDAQLPAKAKLARKHAIGSTPTSSTDPIPIVRTYVYTDGSVSSHYDSAKARVKLDRLQDKSGFNWRAGYTPNNEVKRPGIDAGFSQSGEWTQFKTTQPATTAIAKHQEQPDKPSISYFVVNKAAYIDDSHGLLTESLVTHYYDINGAPYGQVGTDTSATAAKLLETLNQQGITQIAGIISPLDAAPAHAHYATLFGPALSVSTNFYPSGSPQAMDISAQDQTKQRQIAAEEIAAGVLALAGNKLSAPEIVSLLGQAPSTLIETSLDLTTAHDLETFLTQLALTNPDQTSDPETLKAYVQGQVIPTEKKTAFSNALANLLSASPSAWGNSAMSPQALAEAVYQHVVGGEKNPTSIQREISLYDLLKQQGLHQSVSGSVHLRQSLIPRIRDVVQPGSGIDYQHIPAAAQPAVRSLVKQSLARNPGNSELAATMGFALSQYQVIAASTGMKPDEVVHAAEAIALDSPGAESPKRKRIFYENTLMDLIDDAASISSQTRSRSVNQLIVQGMNNGGGSIEAVALTNERALAADIASQQISVAELESLVLPAFDTLSESESTELKAAVKTLELKRNELEHFMASLTKDATKFRSGSTTGWAKRVVNKAYRSAALSSPAPSGASASTTAKAPKAPLAATGNAPFDVTQAAGLKQFLNQPVVKQAGLTERDMQQLIQTRLANQTRSQGGQVRIVEREVGNTMARAGAITNPTSRTQSVPTRPTENEISGYELSPPSAPTVQPWSKSGPAWASSTIRENTRLYPLTSGAAQSSLPDALLQFLNRSGQTSRRNYPLLETGGYNMASSAVFANLPQGSNQSAANLPFATPGAYLKNRVGSALSDSAVSAGSGYHEMTATTDQFQSDSIMMRDIQNREVQQPGSATNPARSQLDRREANYEYDKRALAKADSGGGTPATAGGSGAKGSGNVAQKLLDDILREIEQAIES